MSAGTSAEEIYEYCRLCAALVLKHNLRSFAMSTVASVNLLESIRFLNPGISRGDGLPQSACTDCIRKARDAERLRRNIANAQVILTNLFQYEMPSVKIGTDTEIIEPLADQVIDGEQFNYCTVIINNASSDQATPEEPERSEGNYELIFVKQENTEENDIVIDCEAESSKNLDVKKKRKTKSEKMEETIRSYNQDMELLVMQRLQCRFCWKSFPTDRVLTEHEKSAHRVEYFLNVTSLLCCLCHKTFTNRKRFDLHQISGQCSERAMCSFCKVISVDHFQLYIHKKKMHALKT